jgi:hypothetical protein
MYSSIEIEGKVIVRRVIAYRTLDQDGNSTASKQQATMVVFFELQHS